jgi:hypothetical protein
MKLRPRGKFSMMSRSFLLCSLLFHSLTPHPVLTSRNDIQDMWVDIARTGTFTAGNNGQRVVFTVECFDRLIRGFNEKIRRVPLVFGHPTDSAPAYGWVEALRRAGNTLQAKFKQVHDDVKTLVRNGNFKNISISISPNKSFLHHVGLLGAAQPVISGLREVSFSDGADYLNVEFSPEELQDELEQLKEEVAHANGRGDEFQGWSFSSHEMPSPPD